MARLDQALRKGRGRRAKVRPVTVSRNLLAESDLTYLGLFKIDGTTTSERPIGVAVRWVDGSKRLMFIDRDDWQLVEVAIPALVEDSSNWVAGTGVNAATLVKRWSTSPFGSATITALNSGHDVWGISWDETDKRLYWVAFSPYDPVGDPTATFGWATIDDSGGGTLTAGNRVSLTSPTVPYKQMLGGVLHIPEDFADAHLSGKRLGVGFGTYRSLIAQGSGGSIGPALYAIDPPTGTPAEGTSKPGGPCLMKSDVNDPRQPRPAWAGLADNHFDNGNDATEWDWNTQINNGMVWIDTGTKYGVVVAASFIGGRMTATSASGTTTSVTVTNAAHIVDVVPGDEIDVQVLTGGNGNHHEGIVASIAGATINFSNTLPDPVEDGFDVWAGGQYVNSALHFSRMQTTGLLVYDPADLAEVIATTRQPYDVVPAASWELLPGMLEDVLPGLGFGNYVGSPGGGPPSPAIFYDPVESRLYCYWLCTYQVGLGVHPLVFVYQVG